MTENELQRMIEGDCPLCCKAARELDTVTKERDNIALNDLLCFCAMERAEDRAAQAEKERDEARERSQNLAVACVLRDDAIRELEAERDAALSEKATQSQTIRNFYDAIKRAGEDPCEFTKAIDKLAVDRKLLREEVRAWRMWRPIEINKAREAVDAAKIMEGT